MLAIRLPENIEKRLDHLAKRTGRTKTFYAREALLAHIEPLKIRIWQKPLSRKFVPGKTKPSHSKA